MVSKNHLVVCELFNKHIHGYDDSSYDIVKNHYLCMHVSKNRSIFESRDYNEDDTDEFYECHIMDVADLHGAYYLSYAAQRNKNHPFIRNYKRIISKNNYIQPHIAKVIYLSSGECVAIIKTFWLRLIQRAWKRVFQERKRVFKRRMLPASLRHREIHGSWPKDCYHFPQLHGMLSATATT
uniref:Uncharacterized protein n=1 Tax=viral metagenome TaxID=1070528 RepID=A0A6C0AZH8_9ZZZZ